MSVRQIAAIVVVFSIVTAEATLTAFFAVASLSGDSLGIARAMAIGLGSVLLLTGVPAVLLWWSGRPMAGAAAAIGSAIVFIGLWRFA